MSNVLIPEAIKEVSTQMSDSDVLAFLKDKEVTFEHVNLLKSLTNLNDEVISGWLNISVKTFRSYKLPDNDFKENIQEHILLLLSLIKHGIETMGTKEDLELWLNAKNYFFDDTAPSDFLNTVSGIRFVNDRLTAMEYGDNV